jgi:hypothetical protein
MPNNAKKKIEDSKNALLGSRVKSGKDLQIGDKVIINMKFNFIWISVAVLGVLTLVKLSFDPVNDSSISQLSIESTPDSVHHPPDQESHPPIEPEHNKKKEESPESSSEQAISIVRKTQTIGIVFIDSDNDLQQILRHALGEQLRTYNLNVVSLEEGLPIDLELRSKVEYKQQKINDLGRAAIRIEFSLDLLLFDPINQVILSTLPKNSGFYFIHSEVDIEKAFRQWINTIDLAGNLLPQELL